MKVSPEKEPLKKRIMKQFQCEHCGVSIRGRVSFVHHLNKIHPTDSKVREDLIKCIFCESYFGIKPALTKHIKKCHKERIGLQRFPCLKCSNNCKYQTSSDKLLTTHDDNKTKNIQCAVCGLTLSNKSYRRHLEVHQGAMHQRSPCPKCSNNSEDQTSSDKKTISIQCAECEKTVSKKAYSRHIKIHQGKTHQCNICNKSFHSSSRLERHLLNLHSDSTNKYECELCGGKFTQKENLHRHIKKQHPVGVTVAKRQNKCPYCTTYFRFEASVNLHVAARHTLKAEVPADNDILSKALEKSKIFLTPKPITPATETNTKDGKLSINCHICSRRFSKFHNLKRHNERTHSHIKSFKCPKCPSGFKYSSLLRKHLKHQHEIKCKTNINSVMLSKINDLMSDIFSRKNGNVILIKKSAIDKSLNGISKDSDTSKEITDISSEAREIETNEILIGLSMPVIDNELINSTFNTVKSNHKSISLQKSKKSRTDIDNTVCENIPQVSDRIINTSTQNVPIKISKTESEPVGVQTNFKDAVLGQANSEALFRVINCDHNKNIRINDANPQAQNFQKNIQSFIDEDINTVSLLSGCDAAEYALVDPAQLNIIQVSDMINNNKNNDKPEDNISATNSDYKKQKQAHEISINTLVIGLDTNVLLPNQNYEAGNLADICSTENFEAYNGSHASQNSDQQIMYTEPSNKFTVKEKNPVEYHIREEPSSEYFLVQSSSILGETVQVKIPDREENDVIQYCTANNATMESNISTLQIQEDVQLTASNVYPKVISTLNQSGIDDQERKNQNMFNVDELLNLNPTNSQKNLKASQIHVVGKPKSSDLQIKDIESFKEHASDYQECEPFAKPQSIFNGDDFDKISQKNIKTKIIANSKDSAMDYPECELMGTHQEIYNDELINLNCKKSLKNTSTHGELELSFDLDDLPLETSIADISLTQLDVIEPCNDSNRNVDEFVEKNAIEDRAFFEATSKKAKDYKSASVKENLLGNEINFIDDGKGNFSPIDKTVLTIQENNHEKLIDDFQEITFTPTTFCLDNNTFVESIDSDLIEIENICPSYGVPQSISMNDYLKNKSISPISSNFVNCSKSSKKSDVQLPIESAEIECTNEANLVPEPTINPNILETDLTEDESVTLLELSNISNYIQGYTQELSGDSRLENIISSEVIDSEIPTVDTITEEIIAPEEILKLLSASRLRSYPHKCRICCASFMKQSDLKKHEEIHSERQQFLCHICGKRMTSEATLKKHEMQHEMKFKLMCLHCKNILAPMSMRLHNCVNNKGRYSCPLCDKSFKYGSSKKHHILTNHVYNKKVKSNHEADVLVGMTNEINEMNDTENKQQLPDVPHRVKKPRTKPKIIHQCDECGMEFQRPTHLEQHKNSHNEVKNFMCECGTAFTHERSLKRHKFKFKSPINGIACIKLLGTNEIDIETQQPQ